MIDKVTMEQENLLFSKLTGKAKRDFFVDSFTSQLCFSLRDRRRALGLTQKDIAEAMGVKQSYVSKMENFEKTPTIETIAKYLFALNCPYNEIRTEIESLYPNENALPYIQFVAEKQSKQWSSPSGLGSYSVPAKL